MSEFFGGFLLKANIFANLLNSFGITLNQYDVCGFDCGAREALDYVLNCNIRINRLILLSPAFFNDKDSAFMDSQIELLNNNKKLNRFYKNIGLNKELSRFKCNISIDYLRLFFQSKFYEDSLINIQNKGIRILVFLGGKDKIVDSTNAANFFKNFGVVYFIKEANHLLRIEK